METHLLDQLERIGLVRGRKPGNLHIELALIQRERALQNSVGDRSGDAATMPLTALHHHRNDVFGMIKWRETSKPSTVILMSSHGGLGSAGFARYDPLFQTRSTTGAAVFVNNFPKTFANQLDVVRRDFLV